MTCNISLAVTIDIRISTINIDYNVTVFYFGESETTKHLEVMFKFYLSIRHLWQRSPTIYALFILFELSPRFIYTLALIELSLLVCLFTCWLLEFLLLVYQQVYGWNLYASRFLVSLLSSSCFPKLSTSTRTSITNESNNYIKSSVFGMS